jgi:tetratricopeptide (TPR) repeat protein
LYLEGKNTAEKKTGKTSREYALMCNKLAVDIYLVQKKFNEAEHLLTEVMLIEEKRLGKDHPEYAIALFNLGVCYYEQKKFSDAETLLLKAKNILEKTLGKKHQDYVLVCSYLIKLYESQNRKVLAAMLQKELQEVFKN